MADIMLRTSTANQVTCVSNVFIDDFMKDANGEYVKIYLYLLRCLGREDFEFSLSEVAERLDHTEKDVMRAFTYWEKVGLLRLEYSSENELSGICFVDVQDYAQAAEPIVTTTFAPVTFTAPSAAATAVGAPVTATFPVPMKPSYSADELLEFSSKDGVQDLIFVTETYLGRPLSTTESNSLLYWFDELKMPVDLIEYLVETCISNNHKSFHYMDTVARNWTEDGITSVEAAKSQAKTHSNTAYSIMKAMGISGRDLIKSELDYIDKWTGRYNFNIDIICDACKRTILATNKPSFKYADSILTKWHQSKATSLEDIARLDEQFITNAATKIQASKSVTTTSKVKTSTNNKFNNFNQRDTDYDALFRAKINN